MDIAKYIGLFLLKNNFVYVPGLGNLELKKKSATFTGDALQAPTFEVLLTASGSIDDNLANFIATNEQTSISKASNALRDFSQQARINLQNSQKVTIPAIGYFEEERSKIRFVVDPNFQYTPPPLPTIRIAKKQEDPVYNSSVDMPVVKPRYIDPEEEQENAGGISWTKVTLWILALLLLAFIGYFGFRYLRGSHSPINVPITPALHDTLPLNNHTPAVDSTQIDTTATLNLSNQAINIDVILNSYTILSKAEQRTAKLKTFGHNVELVSEADSSMFYVVLPVSKVNPADTTALLDSLTRVFNPTHGVRILQ
ncbi:MAG: hypothetical protein JSS78_04400 [Bacteroidetes bacterium]|nr:hypothetical protein [Bacteroidota bacterium]